MVHSKGFRAAFVLVLVAGLVAGASALQASPPAPQAASYINGEAPGSPFFNPDVDPASECETPDQRDTQQLSTDAPASPGNKNVHNDACLFDEFGNDFDASITYESKGAGFISACPDPDVIPGVSNGPKVAARHDHDGDGLFEHCHQSGFQVKGIDGDGEYHARLNNVTAPGSQKVTFCYDPDQDLTVGPSLQPAGHGCDDEDGFSKDKVKVDWVA